jgi:hypothetical protein
VSLVTSASAVLAMGAVRRRRHTAVTSATTPGDGAP